MRKSNTEAMRQIRLRKKAELEAGVVPIKEIAKRKQEREQKAGQELTKEWVLDRLQYLTMHPDEASTGAVAACKLLLEQIPKGTTPLEVAEKVSNDVEYEAPAPPANTGDKDEKRD